jgi:hypothetical protein
VRDLPPLEPDPVIEAYKAHVDRTLLRENLKLTPDERLRKMLAAQRFVLALRAAGERDRELRRAATP